MLPAADYRVVTDEVLIEGLSFSVYRRVSTCIFVPAERGYAVEMVTIDPSDLRAAQEQDARDAHMSPSSLPAGAVAGANPIVVP